MSGAPPSGAARGEGLLVAALAAAAALRVLAFSAAFPFFTNVDEHKHVDSVLKYARGYWPRPGGDAFEPETAEWLGTYGSPEYHLEAGTPAPPPPWRRPAAAMLDKLERDRAFLAARSNKEAYQPPVYYALAGAWLRAGRALGLDGARLLYWVRGLGALGLGLLVLASHRSLARVYPDEALVRLGVPALLAVFPLDAVTYVTPDALSPLLGGVAFLLALRVARGGAGAGACAAAGLATAAACLAKYTNAALFGALALSTRRARRARPASLPAALVGMWALALLPVAFWLARNWLLFGDPTATALKAQRLGWEPNPPSAWALHPLWSPSGIAAFATGLCEKFWRGELVWHRELLAWPPADWLYAATSLVFLACAAFALAARRPGPGDRPSESAALLVLVLSVGELVVLSLLFRFPTEGNPSAERPWFDHGRLVAGALVPFLVLYLRGLERATSRLPGAAAPRAAWGVVALVMATALASEIALARPVFHSAYNAYHLP